MSGRFAQLSAVLCLRLAAACGGGGEPSKSIGDQATALGPLSS